MARNPEQLPIWWQGQGQSASKVVLPVAPGHAASNVTSGTEALLAPGPQVDRFPIVIGNALTLQYITSVYRLATQGWRYQAVDVWNELLEHDPHARGVIRQRLLPVVAARMDVIAADLPEDAKESDKKLAADVANEVRRQLRTLPARTQAFGRLMWGVPYGMSASEVEWNRDLNSQAPKGWEVRNLHFIHSRRLNVTDPNSWDVHVYDQGPTSPASSTNYAGGYGLRIADYPGKFILHNPALNGDYATRDGELRYIGVYLALKRMIVRCSAQDFERVIRPWVIGYFSREADKARQAVATTADINQLRATVTSLGLGSLNSAVLPDSARVELLKQVASAGNPKDFADWLDKQVTESLLGQSYTTGPSSHGTHEAAGVAADGTRRINEYDAQCLADTLERDLVQWIVTLNWNADVARRFSPTLKFAVSDTPNPKLVAEVAKILTSIDIPLDGRKVGDMAGMPVIAAGDDNLMATGRTRVIAPNKKSLPIEPSLDDPNDPNYQPPVLEPDAPPTDDAPPEPAPKPEGKKKKPKASKPKNGSRGKQADANDADAIAGAAMRDVILMSDRSDKKVAREVYDQCLEDYPAHVCAWVLAGHWEGPMLIDLDQVDFAKRATWRASHDPIEPYVDKIKRGRMKPVIMVKTPGNDKLLIVDGHHRTLAYEKMGKPVLGYVAEMHTDNGPWLTLHGAQKKGSSKFGTRSIEPSYFSPEDI